MLVGITVCADSRSIITLKKASVHPGLSYSSLPRKTTYTIQKQYEEQTPHPTLGTPEAIRYTFAQKFLHDHKEKNGRKAKDSIS